MTRRSQSTESGLTSLPLGMMSDLGLVETWRPRRIAIAGVRFQSGGDGSTLAGGGGDKGGDAAAAAAAAATQKAADDKAAADTKAAADKAAADKGKTPEQLATEKKAADDKAAADKAAADEKAAKDGKGKEGEKPKAPDVYELKVPDSAAGLVHPSVIKNIEEIARANDWTQEEAQAELEDRLTRTADVLKLQAEEFLAVTTADPEFGGDKLAETTRLSRKAVDAIFPVGHKHRDGFLQLLNRSGVGNKLEVVAFLATLGRQMSEDSTGGGGTKFKAEDVKPDKDVLFPSSTPAAT